MTGKQRAYLRAQANGLDTILYVGKGGITEAVIRQTDIPGVRMMRECFADWLSGDPERLHRRFDLHSPEAGMLRLTPRDPTLRKICRQVELRLDPSRKDLSSIRVDEPSGDVLEIRFLNVRHDPEIPESAWSMPPK